MSLLKGQIVHLGLLGVAGVLALGVWTRDDDAQRSLKPTEVEVWGGSPDSVTALSFDAPNRGGDTVTIDGAEVDAKLADLAKDEDLSRYIL